MMSKHSLTAVQEDYLEAIYRLQLETSGQDVRVSDIAARLGTKLPTVTRAVRRLSVIELLHHPLRGRVRLSGSGRQMAVEIVHRHDDIVSFFVEVLGLRLTEAELDACRIEHGISARTAQRLHDFLEHFATLSRADQKRFGGSAKRGTGLPGHFQSLTKSRVNGWRT